MTTPIEHPTRYCNGGNRPGARWCGKVATLVARATDGLEWFCCQRHSDGQPTRTMEEFYLALRKSLSLAASPAHFADGGGS
jgi:hypothetical protein